jgi:hypothetical protein
MEKLDIECSDSDIKEVYGNTDVEVILYFDKDGVNDGNETDEGRKKCLCISLEDVEEFAKYFDKKLI